MAVRKSELKEIMDTIADLAVGAAVEAVQKRTDGLSLENKDKALIIARTSEALIAKVGISLPGLATNLEP
jgi:hypothetical protein